jgi:hypothetical protein
MVRVVYQFLPLAATPVAGRGVAVVGTPVSLSVEDDCTFSCLIELRLAVPESEFVCEPSPFVSLSPFAFSDRFASVARKLMLAGLLDTTAAGMGEDLVVAKDAIRTPLMLHVACQHLPFATFLRRTELAESKWFQNPLDSSARNCIAAPAIVAVLDGQCLPTCLAGAASLCSGELLQSR